MISFHFIVDWCTVRYGTGRLTEKSIGQALTDVRRALLDADVNVQVADTLMDGVKRRSVGVVDRLKGVTADQQFVKLMYDELLDIMGGDSTNANADTPAATLQRGDPMAVVLLAGLQGAGKTTAAGKLALYLKEREVDYTSTQATTDETTPTLNTRLPKTNRKVLLVGADVYRPAAMDQLRILGESIDVPVYIEKDNTNPVQICQNALKYAADNDFDTVLVDTAGRQVIDDNLMDELRNIQKTSKFIHIIITIIIIIIIIIQTLISYKIYKFLMNNFFSFHNVEYDFHF